MANLNNIRRPALGYLRRGAWLAICGFVVVATSACVTKREAEARARTAYLEGQRQALLTRPVVQGPAVMFVGPVRNQTVPWTPTLSLSQAVVLAGFLGPKDPQLIVIRRQNEEIPVNPQHLLGGMDVPLVMGDVVEIQ